MVNREKLAEAVIKLRNKKRYSQRKLAMVSGLSNSTISRIESASSDTDPETLKKIAPYLDTTYEALMEVAEYFVGVSDAEIPVKENPEETKYPKSNDLITYVMEEAEKYGYDLRDKSKEELAEIIVKALKIDEINKSN